VSAFTRHRRSGRVIANFTGFEADLLRSLASQLVELLRNEEAVPQDLDPLEAMMNFSGPTSIPDDPVLARLFPTAYVGDDEAAAEFRRFTEAGLRDGKAAAACTIIDGLEEAGLPAQLDEEGLMIDVELDQGARDPARGRGGRRGLLGRAARRRPAGPGARHLRLGRLPPGDPGPGPVLSPAEKTPNRSAPWSGGARPDG
jgi:hypothetical protein